MGHKRGLVTVDVVGDRASEKVGGGRVWGNLGV